nr:truncated ORF7b [Severe acute respiratory syndrome coronavirus 2]
MIELSLIDFYAF